MNGRAKKLADALQRALAAEKHGFTISIVVGKAEGKHARVNVDRGEIHGAVIVEDKSGEPTIEMHTLGAPVDAVIERAAAKIGVTSQLTRGDA